MEDVKEAYEVFNKNMDKLMQIYIEEGEGRRFGAVHNFFDRWQYNTPDSIDQRLDSEAYRCLGRAYEATEYVLNRTEDYRSELETLDRELFGPGDKIDPAFAEFTEDEEWHEGIDVSTNLWSKANTDLKNYTPIEVAFMEISEAVSYLNNNS